jgi:electron transfer flavoprotein alpha subunit
VNRARRDPRAERQLLLVPGTGRPRIDRAGRSEPLVMRPTAVAQPDRRVVAEPAFCVLAVPDAPDAVLSAHDRQVIGAAHILAGNSGAVVVLAPTGTDGLDRDGADRVLPYDAPAAYDPAGRAQTVLAAQAHHDPRHILFPESVDGGDLARRVAALMDENVFAAAEALSPTLAIRACRAGRSEQRTPPGRLVTIAARRLAAYAGPPCEARTLPAMLPLASRPMPAQLVAPDPVSLPLAEANFVIAAGQGVTDFALFHEVVRRLGGTPGASRVLCDAGLLPRDRQVGASGTILAADAYLALGISGAPQHLAGIAGVRTVLAVNTDLHAAMVARASLAVIADAQAVMRALLDLLPP